MKRNVVALLWAEILICGCATGAMNADLLQARIREQSLQLTEAQRESAKARSELKQARQEVERLKSVLGDTNSDEASAMASSDQIRKIQISSYLSGGINKDDQPGDDAIVVQFAPYDRDHQPIKRPGKLKLTLIDPLLPVSERKLGSWDVSENECEKQWTRGIGSSGYQISIPLETPPQHGDLVVELKYTTQDDQTFEASQRLKVVIAPANSVIRNSRVGKKPVRVVEEPVEDLPPVGDFHSEDLDIDSEEIEQEKVQPSKSKKTLIHSSSWTDLTIPQYR